MSDSVKYLDVIEWINTNIDEFNGFLSDDSRLNYVSVDDPSTFSSDFQLEWNDQHWPSKDDYGVYFLYGLDVGNVNNKGVYIGKASQRYMGFRVYSHLNKINRDRIPGQYIWDSGDGEFNIDAMFAIPFKVPSLASAFEEFIIGKGHESIRLINKVGVRNKSVKTEDSGIEVKNEGNDWGDRTKQLTRDIFETQNFLPKDNKVWLKNINNYYGYIEQADAFSDFYRVTILEGPKGTETYSSVEEMLEDGWVID